MKKIISTFCTFLFIHALSAQFVAKMEVKGPLPGACDSTNVYALIPGFTGQIPPVAAMTKSEIQAKLNADVNFIKVNPKFKGKMMINCIINCKGEMIRCEVDNKSGEEELDAEILKVFQTLKHWEPGKFNGAGVDCSELFSIEIKKGKIIVS
jgi:hypothetical protein